MSLAARLAAATATLALTTALAACGSSGGGSGASDTTTSSTGSGGGSVVFTGDVAGTWSKAGDANESTCSADQAVIHIEGPGSGDEGELHVKADGSVWLDAEKYGDFTATSGGTLQPNKGLQVNADIATVRGKKAHVSGSLNC